MSASDMAPQPASVVFAGGGDRSHLAPRFDRIPREVLECLADRFELGLKQHGEREFYNLYRDADDKHRVLMLTEVDWWQQVENHLHDHVISLHAKDWSQDDLWGHVGAIMWNAGLIAWRDRKLAGLGLNHDSTNAT